ncbi:MAG: helix-turn-helix transcriptional regulator, partial [Agromyces sp.]
ALARGQLRKQGSVWRDETDLWSDDLNGAYEALLFSYPNDIREALEILALVGPVPVSQAAELVGQNMVEVLEGHGLARLFTTDGHHLAVNPPGLGDYFRHLEPSAHRLRLLGHIEEVLGRAVHTARGPSNEQGVISTAVRQHELPLVARMFSEAYAVDAASTWHEWEQARDVAAAVRVLGLQLTGPADAEQLWQVVRETDLVGVEPALEVEFRFLHARWLTVNERPFEQVEAAMSARPGFVHTGALVALLHGLRMERFGIPDDYENVFAAVGADEGFDREVARVTLAVVRIFAGNGGDALDLLDQSDSPFVTRLADMARGLALFATGRLSEAVEWAGAQAESAVSAGDRPSLAAHSYVAALSLLALARFDEAAEAGNIVVSAGVGAARLLFAPDRALMLTLAMAATRTGRTLAAEGLLERAERYLGRSDALPLGSIAFAEASTVAAEGEIGTAARKFHAAAADLNGRGFTLAADGATMFALMTDYDPMVAEQFRPRADRIGGRLYLAYLDARAASQREDAGALRAAARVLRAEHATDEALKHLTYAARIYRDSGDVDESAEIRSEIRELMRTEDSVTAWAASRAESSWGLTARELEIIDDVAAGMSNIDIAGKHGISVRTIETHMRNIRRKTGAVDREDIATFAKGL